MDRPEQCTLRWGGKVEFRGDEAVISGACVFTGVPHVVRAPAEGLLRYLRGDLIQNAFPDLSADQREFIKSGIGPDGWKQTFGEED